MRTVSGVHAQRLRDARSELVRLNQHRHQRDDVVDVRALAEITKRVDAAGPGAQFEIDQP